MTTKARERAARLLVSQGTDQLAILLDATPPTSPEARTVRTWIMTELERRYERLTQRMDTADIVRALEPITGAPQRGPKSVQVLIDVYLKTLTERHPEAAAAEEQWELDADGDEAVFRQGPVLHILDAVRAL